MLVAVGTTIAVPSMAQQPSTNEKQMAPSEKPSTAQQKMTPNQQIQNEADKGAKTRSNSGESGYVADEQKPGASAQPAGRPTDQATTGSSSGPTKK
jgi:hypothetical protein